MSSDITGPVRVRFAPSPTGFLHVGGARTAIYNDLLRQHFGGAFILRIEDTDRERSDAAMTRQIESALAWLGTAWDEGPFLQSERLARHRERGEELLAAGSAYRCFCSAAELDVLRAAAQKRGEAFRYPRTCAELSSAVVQDRLAAANPFAVRFRMPDRPIRFHDLVRGDMEFPPQALDDFILLRSDGSPTYHMSVVCDDIDMQVSHVIRGEDHLSNTPKHIPLFEALGGRVPTFGHLPLILGTDKKRLSKRFGATSVEEFRSEGFLPQALYNYLALLGWSPGDDREVLSRDEMARLFSGDRLNASAAVFDREKLTWMNAQYLSALPLAELLPHLAPFLAEVELKDAPPTRLAQALELHRSRARTLRELAGQVVPYFHEGLDYDHEVLTKFAREQDLPAQLRELGTRWEKLAEFDKASVERELRALATDRGIKAGVLIHPVRAALSGAAVGPPLFDLVEVMGREVSLRHLAHFVRHLEHCAAALAQAPTEAAPAPSAGHASS